MKKPTIAIAHVANSRDYRVHLMLREMDIYRELRTLSYIDEAVDRPEHVGKFKAAADTLAPLIADLLTNRDNQALLAEYATHGARELKKKGFMTLIGDRARARESGRAAS
jgi:hypothetical protein